MRPGGKGHVAAAERRAELQRERRLGADARRDQASAESEAARAGAAGREAQLAEEAESLRARAAGLEEEVGALRKELEEARAARQAAEASGGEKMRAAESRVAEVEAEVARVRGEGEALERELSALKDQAEELRGREKRSATQLKIKQAVAVALMEELQKRCSSAEVKEVAEETRGHLQGEITMEALRGLTQALHKVVEHVAMADSAKWKDLYGHEHR